MPYYEFNPAKREVFDVENFLSYSTHLQPELIYLANITNDPFWHDQIAKVHQVMRDIEKPGNLYMDLVNVETGKWTSNQSSPFLDSSDFHFNLLQATIMLGDGKNKDNLMEMYSKAVDGLLESKLISTTKSGDETRVIVVDYNHNSKKYGTVMKDDICRLGALLALGAKMLSETNNTESNKKDQTLQMQLAVNLTETCRQIARKTKTNLLPDTFTINEVVVPKGFLRYLMLLFFFKKM